MNLPHFYAVWLAEYPDYGWFWALRYLLFFIENLLYTNINMVFFANQCPPAVRSRPQQYLLRDLAFRRAVGGESCTGGNSI